MISIKTKIIESLRKLEIIESLTKLEIIESLTKFRIKKEQSLNLTELGTLKWWI